MYILCIIYIYLSTKIMVSLSSEPDFCIHNKNVNGFKTSKFLCSVQYKNILKEKHFTNISVCRLYRV